MIKVNLLPREYRKVDGTPRARFAALLVGVCVIASLASVWGYVRLGMLGEVRRQRELLELDLVQVQALADRSRDLSREFTEYERRRETIEQIGKSRMLWAEKMDQLADLLHSNGDTKRHQVWLTSLKTSGKGKDGRGQLQMRGFSGGAEMARLSDFNKDIRDSVEFFKADFTAIDAPAGKRKSFDDNRLPNLGWEFSFGLDLKPAEGAKKGKKRRRKK